jgi:hypothetical protein
MFDTRATGLAAQALLYRTPSLLIEPDVDLSSRHKLP